MVKSTDIRPTITIEATLKLEYAELRVLDALDNVAFADFHKAIKSVCGRALDRIPNSEEALKVLWHNLTGVGHSAISAFEEHNNIISKYLAEQARRQQDHWDRLADEREKERLAKEAEKNASTASTINLSGGKPKPAPPNQGSSGSPPITKG